MAEQTFIKAFGLTSTQNATDILIKKANLEMTPTATDGTDKLAAALIRQLASAFTKADWDSNADINVYAEYGQSTVTFRTIGQNTENLSVIPVTFYFTQPAVTPVITPDNY